MRRQTAAGGRGADRALVVLLALGLLAFVALPLPSSRALHAGAPARSPAGDPDTVPLTQQRVQAADFRYRGAFRLPGGGERPLTFAYGGSAMTFNPRGDPSGPSDGFPGSLFITGHDRMPYGELPNGSQVAEVSIPVPVRARSVSDLSRASFLQSFHDVAAGAFVNYNEIPRIGMQYLDVPGIGPRIHLAWGQHFQFEPEDPTHAWFSPNLAAPDLRGPWYIGNQPLFGVNGYLLEIPVPWADRYAGGRYLGTGRFKDGGLSGMGPTLFAYRPWIDDAGTPAPPGARLPETVLLRYEHADATPNIERSLRGYQHPDEWEGAAWITAPDGRSVVVFAGTKGAGAKYWYGYLNPAGPAYPCVHGEFVGQFPVCRRASGAPCPPSDLVECPGHTSERGWWSSRFDAQLILYDPADLARVATGQLRPWEPQPYAALDIDEHLFLNPAGVEREVLGSGDQRRYRVGDVAYDRANGLLYVLELYADEAAPVVHVWQVQAAGAPPGGPPPPPAPPVACSPRPSVGLLATPDGPGRLRVQVTAGTNLGTPRNRLHRLRFGPADNGLIDAGEQVGVPGDFTLDLPDRPEQVVFVVRRATAGLATTVPLTVVDACGDWPTLVGGGPAAF